MNVAGLSNGSYRVNDTLSQKNSVRTGKKSTDFQNTFNGIHTLVMGGLSSRGLSDGGCVTVYKAEGYSAENPIMRVVTRAADALVKIEVLQANSENVRNYIYTSYDMKILDVVYGTIDADGEVINVNMPGSTIQGNEQGK